MQSYKEDVWILHKNGLKNIKLDGAQKEYDSAVAIQKENPATILLGFIGT